MICITHSDARYRTAKSRDKGVDRDGSRAWIGNSIGGCDEPGEAGVAAPCCHSIETAFSEELGKRRTMTSSQVGELSIRADSRAHRQGVRDPRLFQLPLVAGP